MRIRFGNLAFCGLVLVVALGVAEIMARLDDAIRADIPFTASPTEADLTMRDSLGARGRPHAMYRQWRLNSAGFRGPEIQQQPRHGCTRVAVMGASETFGYYESKGKEYPAQLGDSLSALGCYEVINAAVAGMSLTGQIQLWENWVSNFSPAVVVIYATPAFYLAEAAPKFSPLPRTSNAGRPQKPHSRIWDRLVSRVEFPAFVQRRRVATRIANETAGKPQGWLFQQPPADRLRLFRQHLDSLITDIRSHGTVPVLVTHAMRFGDPPEKSDQDLLTAWRQFTPRATEATLLAFERKSADMVRTLGKDRSVVVVDVGGALTGKGEYFADFTHFNDEGSAIVSGLMAKAIDSTCRHRSQ